MSKVQIFNTVTITGSGNHETLEEFKNKVGIKATFEGSKVSYEKAREFVKENNLLSDSNLKSLFQMRNPESGNLLQSFEKIIDLTNNLHTTFDVIVNANIPAVSANANYNSICKEKTEYSLTLKVEF